MHEVQSMKSGRQADESYWAPMIRQIGGLDIAHSAEKGPSFAASHIL